MRFFFVWKFLFINLCIFFLNSDYRSSGSGGHCVPLTRQTEPNSYSLSPAHPRFPSRVLLLWRAWTASRSSRSTVMIAPLTAYHLLIPGKRSKANIIWTILEEKNSENVTLFFSSFSLSALTSWTYQLMKATKSWDICCCWPFRNARRDSDSPKLWDA